MRQIAHALILAALTLLSATTLTACQPCNDPSQLWCPDEW